MKSPIDHYFANNNIYKSGVAEGPKSDTLFLPTDVRSLARPHDINLTSAQDSCGTNVDVVVNIEPNFNNNMLMATK